MTRRKETPETAPQLLRRHAQESPDRPFLVSRDGLGRTSLTYGEFDVLTDSIAASLLAEGLRPGDRLALRLHNRHSVPFYLLLFAAYKAGVVAVPVNARLVPSETAYIVSDSKSRYLVADAEFLSALEPGALGDCQVWPPDIVDELADAGGGLPPLEGAGPDALADVLYTSGTTCHPKGAVFHHRSLAIFADVLGRTLRLQPGDVYQTAAPIYTSTGTHTCPLPVLSLGGTLVMEAAFDVEGTARVLDDESSSVYFGVPSMFVLLLDRLDSNRQFPNVRSLMYGGSSMPVPIIARLPERFPNAGLWNLYGLTEGGPNGCVLPPEYALERPGSVGFPVKGTEIRIVADDGTDVPTGEPGEITMRAPTVMQGYLNRPEATAEAIVDGWLHTGDIGKRDGDGFIYILDRKKDMIVRGGFNVYPAEIEAALMEHPDVVEVAVVAVPHKVLGEDVGAMVVLRPGARTSREDLEAFCESRLADFKRARHYKFVNSLPRNAMGKVLKRQIREEWA